MSAEVSRSRFPLYFCLGFSAIFLLAFWPGLLTYRGAFAHLEDFWQDRMFDSHYGALRPGDPRVIIAAMDDETVHKYGFPLPRNIHAQLLDKLKGYGVKAAAFDILFIDPREHDAELADAMRRFGPVANVFSIEGAKDRGDGRAGLQNAVPAISAASRYLGYANCDRTLDEDGHLRRHIIFDPRALNPKDASQPAPSIEAAALAAFTGKPLGELLSRYGTPRPVVLTLNLRPPREMPRHAAGGKKEDVIYSPYETISYVDLLSGRLTKEQRQRLRGALVIAGSTAIGYYDHYPTPFIDQAPGVEFHANVIDNLLNGDFARLPSSGLTALAILLMIWLPAAALSLPAAPGAGIAVALLAAWYAICSWKFDQGLHLQFVAPASALFGSFLVLNVHRLFTEGQEKRFIKNLFGQFVAPEVVEDLARDPGKVKLGGEKRDMTIFFLDIAHFTSISEKMKPEALIVFLNKYLSALSQVVHDERGVVDKYIGDCIMAFWNAPISIPDHRAKGCLAAVACQEAMDRLNVDLDHSLPETPAIRIGLNSGEATVGLTGSEKKLQYTVIGDEVNLASRLEGANKFFGSRIMASESTYLGAKDAVEARELGRVRVVGKEQPVRVFELLAKKGGLSPEWRLALPHYERGLELFNKREYAQAVTAFEEVVKVFPKDGPANLYLNASRDYAAIPPDDKWDGVFNLTAK